MTEEAIQHLSLIFERVLSRQNLFVAIEGIAKGNVKNGEHEIWSDNR